MHHLELNRTGPLKIFYELFEDRLDKSDYFQFFANRKKGDNHTFLNSDIFSADKLATVIVEEYSVRGKLAGNVVVIYPDPDFDIPIFAFQLGGNAKKSIALLDISPTLPEMDYTPLMPAFEKYRDLLNMGPSKMDWVNSISSPCLLHAQYEELDIEIFLAAVREYLTVWIEHYYLPGTRHDDQKIHDHVANAVIKYKQVLHDNDPAYGIFCKEWGQPVADAFYHIETRDEPSIAMLDHRAPPIKTWENKDLNIIWEHRAQQRVMQAPEQVQKKIIEEIEAQAFADNMGIVTLEAFEKYKESLLD